MGLEGPELDWKEVRDENVNTREKWECGSGASFGILKREGGQR